MSHHPLPGIQIPVPRLHTALGDPIFPQPGLDCPPFSPSPSQRPPSDGEASLLCNLPLSPAEARACIADLQAMPPEEIARSFQLTLAEHLRAPFGNNEQTALNGFLHDHSNASTPEAEALLQRRQAQCQLLMVWVQEERLLEILQLIRRSAHSEARLSRLLSEADLVESDSVQIETNSDAVRDLLPPWRFVFARLLPFLPPEALLLINDPDMAETVCTTGTRLETTESAPQGGRIFRVDAVRLFPGGTGSVCCFILDTQRTPA